MIEFMFILFVIYFWVLQNDKNNEPFYESPMESTSSFSMITKQGTTSIVL